MHEYQNQFERLLVKAGTLSNKQETTCFISGLKDSILTDIKAHNPTNLTKAIGLTRVYELKNSHSASRGPWMLDQTLLQRPKSKPTQEVHLP